MSLIYDNLLSRDAEGRVVGGLASSYTASPDNMTFAFAMRPGIRCHDGTPFDPALWAVGRFVEGVAAVCEQLGWDQFLVLGDSGGGMLATE